MADAQTFTDVLQIYGLKARYFRFVDGKQWDALGDLFTEDATLFFPEAQPEPLGVRESLLFMAVGMEGCVSIHHGHMPEIEIRSSTQAHGIWAMEDRLFWPPGKPSSLGLETLHGCGHYHEDYERVAGRWLIKRLKMVRLWRRDTVVRGHTGQ
jgi:hypothetical protein